MLSANVFSALCSATQSCPTLCYPMGCSPPGSSVHGILQARILERLPFLPSGDLPKPGIFCLLHWQAGSLPLAPPTIILKVKVAQSCPTVCDPMDYTVHGILQAQNTRVGSLSPLQGIFPTQGSNPGLPHCRRILYQLSHKGSPRILEWVAYPFSSGYSQPRNQTGVSCIAGRFFIN